MDKTKTMIGAGLSLLVALIGGAQMGYLFLLGWLVVDFIRKEKE